LAISLAMLVLRRLRQHAAGKAAGSPKRCAANSRTRSRMAGN